MREIECEVGLLAQLLRNREAFEGLVGLFPGSPHVAREVVAQVRQPLANDFCLQIRSLGTGAEEEAIEDGNVDVHADGPVPIGGNGRIADGCGSGHA